MTGLFEDRLSYILTFLSSRFYLLSVTVGFSFPCKWLDFCYDFTCKRITEEEWERSLLKLKWHVPTDRDVINQLSILIFVFKWSLVKIKADIRREIYTCLKCNLSSIIYLNILIQLNYDIFSNYKLDV